MEDELDKENEPLLREDSAEKREINVKDENGQETGTTTEYVGASESESESSQRSSTGKDFEMLDREELDS